MERWRNSFIGLPQSRRDRVRYVAFLGPALLILACVLGAVIRFFINLPNFDIRIAVQTAVIFIVLAIISRLWLFIVLRVFR
jgi:hypothetical protein